MGGKTYHWKKENINTPHYVMVGRKKEGKVIEKKRKIGQEYRVFKLTILRLRGNILDRCLFLVG